MYLKCVLAVVSLPPLSPDQLQNISESDCRGAAPRFSHTCTAASPREILTTPPISPFPDTPIQVICDLDLTGGATHTVFICMYGTHWHLFGHKRDSRRPGFTACHLQNLICLSERILVMYVYAGLLVLEALLPNGLLLSSWLTSKCRKPCFGNKHVRLPPQICCLSIYTTRHPFSFALLSSEDNSTLLAWKHFRATSQWLIKYRKVTTAVRTTWTSMMIAVNTSTLAAR